MEDLYCLVSVTEEIHSGFIHTLNATRLAVHNHNKSELFQEITSKLPTTVFQCCSSMYVLRDEVFHLTWFVSCFEGSDTP